MLASGELRLEEDPVGRVVRGHVHLRPAQDVVVAVPRRRRLDRVDVRARALLRDRVALVLLPTHRGAIHRSICSGVQTAGAQAGGVWTHQPSAFVTRPICSETRTCRSMLNPPPPSPSGMFIEDSPRSLACRTCAARTSAGSSLVLLGMDLPGISSSSTNRRVRSWISRPSGRGPAASWPLSIRRTAPAPLRQDVRRALLAGRRAEAFLRGGDRGRRRPRPRHRLLPREAPRDHRRLRRREGLARGRQHGAQHDDHPLELPLGRVRGDLRALPEALGRSRGGARRRRRVLVSRCPEPRARPARCGRRCGASTPTA